MWDAAIDSILAPHGNPQRWVAGAALKYKIDENSTFRCKFNNDLQLGMSLQQKLDKSVTVFLSCNVDCVNVTRGGHKVGLAVEINAWIIAARSVPGVLLQKHSVNVYGLRVHMSFKYIAIIDIKRPILILNRYYYFTVSRFLPRSDDFSPGFKRQNHHPSRLRSYHLFKKMENF